jgi:hypothetical protein
MSRMKKSCEQAENLQIKSQFAGRGEYSVESNHTRYPGKDTHMNLRCIYCQTPFTLSRAEMLSAIITMNEKGQNHYDAHCPRCRRANSISRQRMELFFPNWQDAVKQAASAPVKPPPAPASASLKTDPLPRSARAAIKKKPEAVKAAKAPAAKKPAATVKKKPAAKKAPAKTKKK